MRAKDELLRRAPSLTEAQATAVLRVIDSHEGLAAFFNDETELSVENFDARQDGWNQSNAREEIREEPW